MSKKLIFHEATLISFDIYLKNFPTDISNKYYFANFTSTFDKLLQQNIGLTKHLVSVESFRMSAMIVQSADRSHVRYSFLPEKFKSLREQERFPKDSGYPSLNDPLKFIKFSNDLIDV